MRAYMGANVLLQVDRNKKRYLTDVERMLVLVFYRFDFTIPQIAKEFNCSIKIIEKIITKDDLG